MLEKLGVKERIVTVATELFHKQGYGSTGINQIIEEAKVAKASLYYHFKTKEDLCVAYLEKRHADWCQAHHQFILDKDDKVLATFDLLIHDNEVNHYRGCSFINLVSEIPPKHHQILRQVQKHKQYVQLFFQQQLIDFDEDLAFMVYSLFENAIVESQIFRSQAPVYRLKKAVTRLLALPKNEPEVL